MVIPAASRDGRPTVSVLVQKVILRGLDQVHYERELAVRIGQDSPNRDPPTALNFRDFCSYSKCPVRWRVLRIGHYAICEPQPALSVTNPRGVRCRAISVVPGASLSAQFC